VLDELASLLFDLATALERHDRDAVLDALDRREALEAFQATFAEAASMGLEIARYSPLRRRDRPLPQRYATAARMIELVLDDVAALVRGALRGPGARRQRAAGRHRRAARRGGERRPLAPALDDPQRASRARAYALRAAARATQSLELTANLSTSAIVGQVRSTALDLLRGLGEDRDAAAATIQHHEEHPRALARRKGPAWATLRLAWSDEDVRRRG
jgi:murein L,D-transpeptidase YcbB/YkuD